MLNHKKVNILFRSTWPLLPCLARQCCEVTSRLGCLSSRASMPRDTKCRTRAAMRMLSLPMLRKIPIYSRGCLGAQCRQTHAYWPIWPVLFSWEPAEWTQMSQERVLLLRMRSQKSIAISIYKQWLLSIDLKAKVVQHVRRINIPGKQFKFFNVEFWVFWFSWFPAFVWHSDIFNSWLYMYTKLWKGQPPMRYCSYSRGIPIYKIQVSIYFRYYLVIWRRPKFFLFNYIQPAVLINILALSDNLHTFTNYCREVNNL